MFPVLSLKDERNGITKSASGNSKSEYITSLWEEDRMEFEKMQQIIADVLSVDLDEITPETTFKDDLGADSLDVFQIIMAVEEEFNIEIPTEEAEKITTVGDAVEAIKNAVS